MSTQGGLKHAATEPSHLDNKRETRRRGAAGRAAALRRAPSDSDCSGETASLSADSADRRPAPPPPRQAKARSRRRGSEWEVLEGLKDGQRFERRPDVFNGYLHKKRKWPLKGWHKRFFVVDGGILVYARSPADVSRGRLHGSVDVGLSVLSAKARRRRIDIDADEFIYHLRAKTQDVFRTWLNVLKAHRLYRQHLLTFGARESVPMIHAPLDDLPQTDTSSRSSSSSSEMSTSELSDEEDVERFIKEPDSNITPAYSQNMPCCNKSCSFRNMNESLVENWHDDSIEQDELIPLIFEPLEDNLYLKPAIYHSLCSMQCLAKRYENEFINFNQSAYDSLNVTENEKQVDFTDLDKNSPQYTENVSPAFEHSVDYYATKDKNTTSVYPVFTELSHFTKIKSDSSSYLEKNIKPMTTLFLFGRKKKPPPRVECPYAVLKRSKKSTNVVKYRNMTDEPPLKKPLSKSMLLNKCKDRKPFLDKRQVNKEVSADTQMENKSLQDTTTASEFDRITERLITSIFQARSHFPNSSQFDSRTCISQIVKQLYDIKWSRPEVNPAKILFRCLLEYWLKTSSVANIKDALTCVKSTDTRSNHLDTTDVKLSCIMIRNVNKQTQFNGYIPNNATVRIVKSPDKDVKRPRNIPYSYMKERRIQELEKLLKSTVYTCETLCNTKSKEKDIEITRKLIRNLDNPKSANLNSPEAVKNSNSSTEFPEIQDTFNHLISETSIPPSVAKEFLGAYLDVLLSDNANTASGNNTSSSDESKKSQELPSCEVDTEAVQRKISKGILTGDKKERPRPLILEDQDPGQKYLKDVLDKITRMFSKVKTSQDKDVQPDDTKVEGPRKGEVRRTEYPVKNLITENHEENSVVIDLTRFDLDHITMFEDPAMKGVMSINIKLKERTLDYGESKQKNLNLKFCEEKPKHFTCAPDRFNPTDSSTRNFYRNDMDPRLSFKNPYIDFDPNLHQRDKIELKPYLSTSDATSKAYRILYESQHSIDSKKSFDCPDECMQSCYLLSNIKKNVLTSPFTSKKKVRVNECNGVVIGPREQMSRPGSARRTELTVLERSAPRIIDEKFILLLLENLTMLSQNIPGLHKDISGLYIKLKKKHERDLKTSPNAGLGLLGKIYNEENKQTNDNDTQYDMTLFPEKPLAIRSLTEIGLNTSKNFKPVDKCTSGVIRHSILRDTDVQTVERQAPKRRKKSVNFIDAQTSTQELDLSVDTSTLPDKVSLLTVDTAVSSPNWFQLMYTKDCGISTAIKCLLNDKSGSQNFRILSEEDKRRRPKTPSVRQSMDFKGSCHDFRIRSRDGEKTKGERKQWSKATEDINFQEPCQSRAEQRYSPHKERKIKRDFNVYQLFVSRKFQQSPSACVSNFDGREWSEDMNTIYRCHSDPSFGSGLISPTSPPLRGPQAGFVSGTPGGRLASWIIESGGPLETASRELGQAQLSVQQLQRLLDALELQHQHHDTDQVSLEGASPNVKKDRRKFGLRKKKSNSKCASVELAPPVPLHVDASSSHMALSALTAPPSPGGGASSAPNSAASLPIDP